MGKGAWVIAVSIALAVALGSWVVLPELGGGQIQAVASTMATVAGILFGFVMACVTLLASATDNTLVRNTQKTGYLPKLLRRMQHVMAALLGVCVLFLWALFVPVNYVLVRFFPRPFPRAVDAVMVLGVFAFALSIWLFVGVWRRFSHFATHM